MIEQRKKKNKRKKQKNLKKTQIKQLVNYKTYSLI